MDPSKHEFYPPPAQPPAPSGSPPVIYVQGPPQPPPAVHYAQPPPQVVQYAQPPPQMMQYAQSPPQAVQYAQAPPLAAYATAPSPPQQAPGGYPPPPLMLDVVVQYEYWGARGGGRAKNHTPSEMHRAERRLRITVDDLKTAAAIRDEVLARKDIIPPPYGFLGVVMKSGNGFELGENDLIRYVSAVLPTPPIFIQVAAPHTPPPHTHTHSSPADCKPRGVFAHHHPLSQRPVKRLSQEEGVRGAVSTGVPAGQSRGQSNGGGGGGGSTYLYITLCCVCLCGFLSFSTKEAAI